MRITLGIDFVTLSDADILDARLLKLSSCKKLRHLTLANTYTSFPRSYVWEEVLGFLPHLRLDGGTLALETIHIEFSMTTIRESDLDGAEYVGETDSSLAFLAERGSFARFQIIMSPRIAPRKSRNVDSGSWQAVCKAFPLLAAARLLNCHLYGVPQA